MNQISLKGFEPQFECASALPDELIGKSPLSLIYSMGTK